MEIKTVVDMEIKTVVHARFTIQVNSSLFHFMCSSLVDISLTLFFFIFWTELEFPMIRKVNKNFFFFSNASIDGNDERQ